MNFNFKALPHLPISKKRDLPKISAIYFVVSDENLIYVGLTVNLRQRWSGHHLLREFPDNSELFWLETDESDLADKEKEFIEEFSPPMNSNPGGAGRPKGSKNFVAKPQGKQLSVWLSPEALVIIERLKRKESYGALICRALVALENAESESQNA